MELTEDRVLGGLVGLCTGDALGVPFEGMSRTSLKRNPIRGFSGESRALPIPVGWWSDDSSLTLCLSESIAESLSEPNLPETAALDLESIGRSFCRWLFEGYWTPEGQPFGIGRTTAQALERIRAGVPACEAGGRDEFSNGNGSLMRILPLAYYLFDSSADAPFSIVHDVSSITHAHPRSQLACGIYIQTALNLLEGHDPLRSYALMCQESLSRYSHRPYKEELGHFERVLNGTLSLLPEKDIASSGYVVDTLEASIWCFLHAQSFEEAVLAAVNLGGDADTTGAVCGGLAGLHYGYHSIPPHWVRIIARSDDIISLGMRMFRSIMRLRRRE
jgi:ADP-ribosylglycohydrolase